MIHKTLFITALILFGTAGLQAEEELDKIFAKVNELVAAKNYPKALEELNWAKNAVNKKHTEQMKSYLPDELGGFKGDKLEVNSALGMTNLERNYKSGNANVKVSLMGSSKNSGMGGIANMGRLAAMMGGQGSGQEAMRIDGKTASMNVSGSRTELSVFLDSGGILKLETRKANDAAKAQLKKMAEEMKLTQLDQYLAGTLVQKPAA